MVQGSPSTSLPSRGYGGPVAAPAMGSIDRSSGLGRRFCSEGLGLDCKTLGLKTDGWKTLGFGFPRSCAGLRDVRLRDEVYRAGITLGLK